MGQTQENIILTQKMGQYAQANEVLIQLQLVSCSKGE
jgi:hypothetical protein